jgi:hypothetical protein
MIRGRAQHNNVLEEKFPALETYVTKEFAKDSNLNGYNQKIYCIIRDKISRR